MTTAAIDYAPAPAPASSEIANAVDSMLDGLRKRLRETVTLSIAEPLEELGEIFNNCRFSGWDGYDAAPVEIRTIRLAQQFLEALPLNVPTPSVGVEPDGQVTFEWRQSPRRVLSISITPDDEIHFAAILDKRKRYGTDPFLGETPQNSGAYFADPVLKMQIQPAPCLR